MESERGKLLDPWVARKCKKCIFQRRWGETGQSSRRFQTFSPIGRSELIDPTLEYLCFGCILTNLEMER